MNLKKMNNKAINLPKGSNKTNNNKKVNNLQADMINLGSGNSAANNAVNNNQNNSPVETLVLNIQKSSEDNIITNGIKTIMANFVDVKNNNDNNNSKKITANVKVSDVFKYSHDKKKGTMQGYTVTDKYHVMI